MSFESDIAQEQLAREAQHLHEEESIQVVVQQLRSEFAISQKEELWVLDQMSRPGTSQIEGSNYIITRDLEGGFEVRELRKAA